MPGTASRKSKQGAIRWRDWGADTFAEAAAAGRPILLNLSATWCHWCRLMDEGTWSEPDIVALVSDELVPLRVDADRHPHVQDRYIAGGWPTTAFLTPTGEVLWAGTYVEAAQFREVAGSVLAAWGERREALELEIDRRRRAAESTGGRGNGSGLVRREPADDVLTAALHTFDARNGGFGDEPKFPLPELVELLYSRAAEDPQFTLMADQTLDGMLAGELWDAAEGGFFRYALAPDWTAPRCEKLLDVNAGLLEAYALGARLRGRPDWGDVADGIVAWADRVLARDGYWAASQAADPDYFAADTATRRELVAPPVDATLYTSVNARWIHALATAGARLGRDEWVARADAALRGLIRVMGTADGGLHHFRAPGGAPALDFLLVDMLEVARAALALAQATGAPEWLETARALARRMESECWRADGAFADCARGAPGEGMLRYPQRPFEANATAARVLLDLAQVTGERNWRGLAERTLAVLGPLAGRYGTSGAVFALATDAFFEAPPAVFIAAPAGADATLVAALRSAAFLLPVPALHVWTVPAGHAVGPQRFPAEEGPAVWVWTRRGCAGPVAAPELVAAAGASVL